ncbi:MAG: AIM24 family protein [Thermodesulfobacteriota bacterium]|nr:AIM24 family protein [Thermodesulfobacteriota bacterium]
MRCHEVDYEILGHDMQIVEVELDPGETVIAGAGAMNYMDVHAGGTVIEKELNNDVLRVDTGCLVAFTKGIDYSIERAGNLKSMFFGGEGLFLATLKGTGTVFLQSLPFSRMADRILAHAPSGGGSSKGEGSLLGRIGGMMDGD